MIHWTCCCKFIFPTIIRWMRHILLALVFYKARACRFSDDKHFFHFVCLSLSLCVYFSYIFSTEKPTIGELCEVVKGWTNQPTHQRAGDNAKCWHKIYGRMWMGEERRSKSKQGSWLWIDLWRGQNKRTSHLASITTTANPPPTASIDGEMDGWLTINAK